MVIQTSTVVVSAYNAAEVLEKTLDSIAAQSFSDFVCHIVNDASNDGTREIANRFCDKDQRFHLINHLASTGVMASYNTGLRATKTKFVCFLEASEVMLRDGLEARLAPIQAQDDEDVIGSYCPPGNKPKTSAPAEHSTNETVAPSDTVPFERINQLLLVSEKVVALGGFNEGLAFCGDLEFLNRMTRAGYATIPVTASCIEGRSQNRGAEHAWTTGSINADPRRKIVTRPMRSIVPTHQMTACLGAEIAYRLKNTPGKPVDDLVEIAQTTTQLSSGSSETQDTASFLLSGAADYHRVSVDFLTKEHPELVRILSSPRKEDFEPSTTKRALSYRNASADTGLVKEIFLPNETERSLSIFFLLQKDYHIDAIAGVYSVLQNQGIQCQVVDLSPHCGDRGLRSKAKELGIELVGLNSFMLGLYPPDLIVALNDWDGSVRAIFGAAQASGIKTVAMVEGIQDYWDADVSRDRGAYRTADVVLLPGRFDRRYFKDSSQQQYVCGIPRIERMRNQEPVSAPETARVLINTNFSYGVLIEHRDAWLKAAVKSCEDAGLDWAISKHPADRGTLFQEHVTKESFEIATLNNTVVVQRFASGILESLALGRPTIYFNPHGEKVDKFKEPLGAYPIANNREALTDLLKQATKLKSLHEAAWPRFLNEHCTAEGSVPPDEVIVKILGQLVRETSPCIPELWRTNLRAVDQFSLALFDLKRIHQYIPPTYARFSAELDKADEKSFAQRLQAVDEREISTRSKLNIIAEKKKLKSKNIDAIKSLKARQNIILLQIDHFLEIFYHKNKNTPVFGKLIRKASSLYDIAFKKTKN